MKAEFLLSRLLWLNIAVSFGGLALAYGLNKPGVFCKKPSGRISWLGYLVFWPYFCLNFISLALYRLLARESFLHEVIPGMYLGCRPWGLEGNHLERLGIKSTLDLTAEFPEVPLIRTSHRYLCLPLLDTSAPTQAQFQEAVAWLTSRHAEGPVFVHCGLGHGRSALVVAAYLIRRGVASSPSEALEVIRRKRPRVRLRQGQWAALHKYAEQQIG